MTTGGGGAQVHRAADGGGEGRQQRRMGRRAAGGNRELTTLRSLHEVSQAAKDTIICRGGRAGLPWVPRRLTLYVTVPAPADRESKCN